ncbi:MAG TPA: DUF222 domain-containing protein [Nitriliruptorales bacterium]|nr:DUF222 domain-containing protein [Nitriliruptorales bacterium]
MAAIAVETDVDLGGRLAALHAAVDAVAQVDPALVHPDELGGVLRQVKGARDRLDAVHTRLLAVFAQRQAQRGEGMGATTSWLREELRLSPPQAERDVETARQVAQLPAVQDAFAAGEIGAEHAQVLARELADPATPHDAEQELVDLARVADPEVVARAARTLRIQADPAAADDVDRRAFEGRWLQVRPDPDGTVTVKGRLDQLGGETLLVAMDALCRPEAGEVPVQQRRTREQRLADALVDLAGRCLQRGLTPATGGTRPQVTLVLPAQAVVADPGAPAPELAWTGAVAPSLARLVSCDADVIRLVMDASGRPLDLGRSVRTVPGWLRAALDARDRGCRRCGAPPAWCQAHHLIHWADGGPTSEANLVLLCRACHRTIHTGGWTVRLHPDTTVTFTRPDRHTITRAPP